MTISCLQVELDKQSLTEHQPWQLWPKQTHMPELQQSTSISKEASCAVPTLLKPNIRSDWGQFPSSETGKKYPSAIINVSLQEYRVTDLLG